MASANQTQSSAGSSTSTPALVFHAKFDKKRAGDVILQSDDELSMCFFFPMPLLSALSTFFAGLPPPSPADQVNGSTLIPLPETSSGALLVALSALQSTTQAEGFVLPRHSSRRPKPKVDVAAIIDAAVFASRFDLPVLYRLLLEGIQRNTSYSHIPFLRFAIWCISRVTPEIIRAGEDTIHEDITKVARPVRDALRRYAPSHWMQVQDLHLRRARGLARFHEEVYAPRRGCEECVEDNEDCRDHVDRVIDAATNVEDLLNLLICGFGLACEDCEEVFRNDFIPAWTWLTCLTSKYDFDKTYAEYKKAIQP